MNLFYPDAKQHIIQDHDSGPGSLKPAWVVLHITQGSTAGSAIITFEMSRKPNRVSAHFVVDRDGTVYQLVALDRAAWHASQCNGKAIGIEHAAIAGKLMATDEQYAASAKLVKWLCEEFSIPLDRTCVKTHNEASPKDGHVLCCTGALDPDKVVEQAKTL